MESLPTGVQANYERGTGQKSKARKSRRSAYSMWISRSDRKKLLFFQIILRCDKLVLHKSKTPPQYTQLQFALLQKLPNVYCLAHTEGSLSILQAEDPFHLRFHRPCSFLHCTVIFPEFFSSKLLDGQFCLACLGSLHSEFTRLRKCARSQNCTKHSSSLHQTKRELKPRCLAQEWER